MQDKELYQHLLGLSSPWSVAKIELDTEGQEIVVAAGHRRGAKFSCPKDRAHVSVVPLEGPQRAIRRC